MISTVEPCLTEIPFIRTTTSLFRPLYSGPYLLTCLLCNFRTSMKLRRVARIFQMGAGSHCVKVRAKLVMSSLPPVVGCWARAPQDLPATLLKGHKNDGK